MQETQETRRQGFDPWLRKMPWRKKWQPVPGPLLGESHGQRCPVAYSLWGHKESDTTEQLTHSMLMSITSPSQLSRKNSTLKTGIRGCSVLVDSPLCGLLGLILLHRALICEGRWRVPGPGPLSGLLGHVFFLSFVHLLIHQ